MARGGPGGLLVSGCEGHRVKMKTKQKGSTPEAADSEQPDCQMTADRCNCSLKISLVKKKSKRLLFQAAMNSCPERETEREREGVDRPILQMLRNRNVYTEKNL